MGSTKKTPPAETAGEGRVTLSARLIAMRRADLTRPSKAQKHSAGVVGPGTHRRPSYVSQRYPSSSWNSST